MRLRCLMGANSGRELDYAYLAGEAALAAGNAERIVAKPEEPRAAPEPVPAAQAETRTSKRR